MRLEGVFRHFSDVCIAGRVCLTADGCGQPLDLRRRCVSPRTGSVGRTALKIRVATVRFRPWPPILKRLPVVLPPEAVLLSHTPKKDAKHTAALQDRRGKPAFAQSRNAGPVASRKCITLRRLQLPRIGVAWKDFSLPDENAQDLVPGRTAPISGKFGQSSISTTVLLTLILSGEYRCPAAENAAEASGRTDRYRLPTRCPERSSKRTGKLEFIYFVGKHKLY